MFFGTKWTNLMCVDISFVFNYHHLINLLIIIKKNCVWLFFVCFYFIIMKMAWTKENIPHSSKILDFYSMIIFVTVFIPITLNSLKKIENKVIYNQKKSIKSIQNFPTELCNYNFLDFVLQIPLLYIKNRCIITLA